MIEKETDFPVSDIQNPRSAIRIDRHGGTDQLKTVALLPLVLQPGEVRFRVSHVALNHLDLWVRRGVPGHDFGLPRVPGSDVSGTVAGSPGRYALHPSRGCGACPRCLEGRQNRCARFRIRGESEDGGCVTEIAVPRWQLLPIPDHLSLAEGAALPLTLLTAWHMLVVRAELRRGERVLIQAGGSGVGVMAIQIARLMGCEVHATSGRAEVRERLKEMGATPHDYSDLPRSCDVVVETVGRDTWDASLRALAWGGRLVCCGATAGPEVGLNLRALFFKQISLLGSTMGGSGDMLAAWREVQAGTIRPVVDRVFPMSRIADAHSFLESRQAFGKVLLEQDLSAV